MAYEIYLGDCALYGVTSVEESAARSVTEQDAIGLGMFTIPQNAGLRSWNIKLELTQTDLGQEGWRKASKVLDELQEICKDKSGQRLVIIASQQRLSQLVLLRDIKADTSYAGTYSVSLSFIEYVKAQVKTTGVPSVTRAGTMPKLPDTVRVLDAYKVAAYEKAQSEEDRWFRYADPNNRKPVNPAGLNDKEVVKVINEDSNSASVTEQQKEQLAMGAAMSSAYDEYESVLGSE